MIKTAFRYMCSCKVNALEIPWNYPQNVLARCNMKCWWQPHWVQPQLAWDQVGQERKVWHFPCALCFIPLRPYQPLLELEIEQYVGVHLLLLLFHSIWWIFGKYSISKTKSIMDLSCYKVSDFQPFETHSTLTRHTVGFLAIEKHITLLVWGGEAHICQYTY